MKTASTNTKCLLTWGVPAVLLVVLMVSVFAPWWQRLGELSQRIERTQDQIQNYQRLIATLPQMEAELQQVRNREDTKAFYLEAKTPALAGAELQSEVQDIIRAGGGQPISTQILPVDESEQPPRIRIRVQFKGSTESLLSVLYRIEAARPFLFIDQISLRSAASNVPLREVRNVRQRQQGVQARHRDELTLRLDIFGFALGSGA